MKKQILATIVLSALPSFAIAGDIGAVTCKGTFGKKKIVISQDVEFFSQEMTDGSGLSVTVDGVQKDTSYSQLSTLYTSPGVMRKNPIVIMSLQNDGTETVLGVEYLGVDQSNRMVIPGRFVGSSKFTVAAKAVTCSIEL